MRILLSFHIFILFLLALPGTALLGQDSKMNPPAQKAEDDSSLRISLADSWFRESPGKVLSKRPETYTLKGGSRVQVRVETSPQNRNEFAVVLAREQNGAFPGWARGSWVFSRRRDNNPEGSRIRVFLRSDYNTYVQFRPFTDEKCLFDVVVYDSYLVRSLPLAIPFERLFVLPVEEALTIAGKRFPRRYFDPEPGTYRDSRAFAAKVRARLPELIFRDDGALDENGDYVFIDTLAAQEGRGGLNCSGFAKWVVDGILKPRTGEWLPIAPLKEPFGDRGSSYSETWEALRDPFFGLDWCRNLASRAGAILRSSSFSPIEEIEVRNLPFSELIQREAGGSAVYPYSGHIQNAGFGIEGLLPLLYTLAIDEPGRIYLAAVNREIAAPVTRENPRGLPRLRQYYHIAVLVPYFSERGNFRVDVFESAEETSFSKFKTRYPQQCVNLVRIPIEDAFDP